MLNDGYDPHLALWLSDTSATAENRLEQRPILLVAVLLMLFSSAVIVLGLVQ
jgi:hypothetical protein